jgi:protein involved in ribonucleotide reduction
VDKHASQDFLNFMEQLKSASPTDQEIHIILDNYVTIKPRLSQSGRESVEELVNKIYLFIEHHKNRKKVYHWMAKVERAKSALAASKAQV